MQASPDRRGRNRRRRPQQGYEPHSYESNGPDIKIRGTPQTIADKYTQLARDSLGSGDLVLAENYFQHAEHYIRLLIVDEPIASSRPPIPIVYDESVPQGEETESNVTPLERLQGEPQSSVSLQEGRSYERPSRSRDHGNGEGYHTNLDRGPRPSAQRYRASGGAAAALSRDDSRGGERQKRLDRGYRRDSRRGYESAHHNRRSWSQTSGCESEEENGGHDRSSSSTFHQNGLPAFLSTPVAMRAPVGFPASAHVDLASEGTPSEFEERNREISSANFEGVELQPISSVEASKSSKKEGF